MNFSDYSTWNFIVQFGIMMVIILIANIIRRKIPFIKKSLVPTSVIAGLLIMAIRNIDYFKQLIDKDFLELVTYHTIALGFISIALKVQAKEREKSSVIMRTGAITVGTYVIQGIVGLGITLILSITFMPDLFQASGLILPLGFGQGPGQAMNFGKIYEGMGFIGGTDFGLTVAGIGFLVACLVGVVHLNVLRHKGKILIKDSAEESSRLTHEDVSNENEIPLSESVDKMTIQISIVFATYFITYLLILGLTKLSANLGDFGTNTVAPLLWGFNFLFGVLVAFIVGLVMKRLKKVGIMNRQYPNNFLLNRLGGLFFDLMVVASIGAIELNALKPYIIVLTLLTIFGTIVTMVYLKYVCKRIYPTYEYEAYFSMFGMLTGTASTGMVLLREIDNEFKTPAANNLVLQNLPAIMFGFPLMLLLVYAPLGTSQAWITLGVLVIMFIALNVFVLWNFIKKKPIAA